MVLYDELVLQYRVLRDKAYNLISLSKIVCRLHFERGCIVESGVGFPDLFLNIDFVIDLACILCVSHAKYKLRKTISEECTCAILTLLKHLFIPSEFNLAFKMHCIHVETQEKTKDKSEW